MNKSKVFYFQRTEQKENSLHVFREDKKLEPHETETIGTLTSISFSHPLPDVSYQID